MNRSLLTLALILVVACTWSSGRAGDTPDGRPSKPVTKSWHRWTVKEIIRDFLVQVEFDAQRSKKDLGDFEKTIKNFNKERGDNTVSDVFEEQVRRKKDVVRGFEKLEMDIKAFDQNLDETTRELRWADKRFDKHRDRLDQLARRVEGGRLPCEPFSMSPDLSNLLDKTKRLEEEWKRKDEDLKRTIEEMDRQLQELERRIKEREKQAEPPKKPLDEVRSYEPVTPPGKVPSSSK